MAEPRWLTNDEIEGWVPFAGLALFLQAYLDQALKAHGLTFFEYATLSTLSSTDDDTMAMTSLADLTNGSLSRMSHATGRLEKRGLVRRRRCPDDGRVTLVELLPAGRHLLEEAAPDHVASVRAAIFDQVDPDEFDTVARGVRAVVDHINPGGPPNG